MFRNKELESRVDVLEKEVGVLKELKSSGAMSMLPIICGILSMGCNNSDLSDMLLKEKIHDIDKRLSLIENRSKCKKCDN